SVLSQSLAWASPEPPDTISCAFGQYCMVDTAPSCAFTERMATLFSHKMKSPPLVAAKNCRSQNAGNRGVSGCQALFQPRWLGGLCFLPDPPRLCCRFARY